MVRSVQYNCIFTVSNPMAFAATYRRIAKVDLRIPNHISPDAKDLIIRVRICSCPLSRI